MKGWLLPAAEAAASAMLSDPSTLEFAFEKFDLKVLSC